MLTLLTAFVSCAPEAMDPTTDPDRAVFYCRDERIDVGQLATELHVSCSGALAERVLDSVAAGDRVLIAGTAQVVATQLSEDFSAGRFEIEAMDVQLISGTSRRICPSA